MSSTPDNGDVTAVDAAQQEFNAARLALSELGLEVDAYQALQTFSATQRAAASRKLEEIWPKMDALMEAFETQCIAYSEAKKAAAKAARRKAG
jgi:hypothetical protein